MNHPPIPPRCKYLKSNDGKHPMIGKDGVWTFCGELDRICIVAIARCAWLDEAKRQHQSTDKGIGPAACYDNAEAWRIWGEQK